MYGTGIASMSDGAQAKPRQRNHQTTARHGPKTGCTGTELLAITYMRHHDQWRGHTNESNE